MDVPGIYGATRARLLALAGTLAAEQTWISVPALPGWTVKEAYAHLAGLCADLLDGTTEGMGTPAWTAQHLAARAQRNLAEICDEWRERGPQLDEFLRDEGQTAPPFVVFDVWNHEQDIHGALGRFGEHDDERVHAIADAALAAFDERFRATGAPTLRIVGDRTEHVLGAGDPAATVELSDYEALRVIFGRRSRAQIEAAGWTGDTGPFVEHLHLFDLPVRDLVD